MNNSIEQILCNHFCDESIYHTHVSMIKPMGKFQFNRQDIETFWDLYLEKIENDPNPVVGIAKNHKHSPLFLSMLISK